MNSVFRYVALDQGGAQVEGELTARSRAEAIGLLARKTLQPVSLNSVDPSGGILADRQSKMPARDSKPIDSSGKLTRKPDLTSADVMSFTEELADLLDAGLQLDSALKIIESKSSASRVGRAAALVRGMVVEGTRLSQALPAISRRFEGLYASLVAAGEVSGSLAVILQKQLQYMSVMQELRAKVVQALIYPSFVFVAGLVLIVIFMTVLVPQLSMLFSKSGSDMPLPTKILINSSQFFETYWWLIALLIVTAAIGIATFVSKPRGKALWHRIELRLPLIGGVFEANFFAQFAHTLANLTVNGIPLLDALRLFNTATANIYLRGILTEVVRRVGEGAALSKVLQRSGAFPPDFTDLVAVGEQTGDLSAALGKVASRFDKALSVRIQRITAFIQPCVIFLLAILVGLFAYSILAGIFQAVSGLRPKT